MGFKSNIWKFYLYKVFGSLELTISFFVLFLLNNNLSMVLVMALETIFIVLVLITEVPSGAIADFIGRKNAMALALLSASIGFMVFGLGNNLWHFLIAQIISVSPQPAHHCILFNQDLIIFILFFIIPPLTRVC